MRVIILLLAVVLTMAHGKFEYTPYPSRAAALTAARYLLLAEPDNLFGVNPGAETGDMTGWTGAGCSVTAGAAYVGSYKFQVTSGNYLDSDNSANGFDLVGGQKYKIIFAVKRAAQGGWFNVEMYDENGIFLPALPTPNFTVGVWNIITLGFTPDRNYYGCTIRLENPGAYADTAYFDSILITPEYLDMGTDDFSIDILHQPLTQTGTRVLAQKLLTASPYNGFQFYYNGTDYKYYLFLSDGSTSVTVSSAAVTAIQNQQYHWGRVTIDRSGFAKFYIDGVQSGSDGNIAAVTGNISTTGELRLFGYNSTDQLYKGFCGFIRFQRGTIRSDTWMAEEWARIQAGRIRKASSATAMWEFDDSLTDECQDLMLQENTGTLTYADGWPYCVSPISYTFPVNYRHERRMAPLGGDSLIRSYRTGAAYLIPAPRKDSWELPFVGITQAQYSAFLAAYEGGEPIDLWLDADNEKTGQFYISPDSPPEMEGIPYFRNGELVVNTTLYLVET